jgi:hypothetical protein
MRPELLPNVLELGYHLTAKDVRKLLNTVILREGLTDAEKREKLDVFQNMSSRLRFTFDHILSLIKGELDISSRVDHDMIFTPGIMDFLSTLELEGILDFSLL